MHPARRLGPLTRDAVVGGIQVREDRDHLYGAYTLAILDELMALLDI